MSLVYGVSPRSIWAGRQTGFGAAWSGWDSSGSDDDSYAPYFLTTYSMLGTAPSSQSRNTFHKSPPLLVYFLPQGTHYLMRLFWPFHVLW